MKRQILVKSKNEIIPDMLVTTLRGNLTDEIDTPIYVNFLEDEKIQYINIVCNILEHIQKKLNTEHVFTLNGDRVYLHLTKYFAKKYVGPIGTRTKIFVNKKPEKIRDFLIDGEPTCEIQLISDKLNLAMLDHIIIGGELTHWGNVVLPSRKNCFILPKKNIKHFLKNFTF